MYLLFHQCTSSPECYSFILSAGGNDYINAPVFLLFTPEMLQVCFNITIVDDDYYENTEEFFVNITTTDPQVITSPMTTVVTIEDNDGKEYKYLE